MPALEMKVLRPLISQPPSRRSARVRDPAGVGAGVGLGQPERAEGAALGQRPQPSLPLRVVAEQVQRQRADGHVGLPGGGHRLVGQADLLHGGDEADRRHADPAPLLGDQHAEQAQRAHLPEQVGRAPRLLPRQRGARRDLLLGEVAAQPDQVAFGFGEREVHGRSYWTDRYNARLRTPVRRHPVEQLAGPLHGPPDCGRVTLLFDPRAPSPRGRRTLGSRVEHHREEALERDVAVARDRTVPGLGRPDHVVGDLCEPDQIDVLPDDLSSPRSYQLDWRSSMTLVPARRATSIASRCQKTKLMSTRSGLVGSSSKGTPTSPDRRTAGATISAKALTPGQRTASTPHRCRRRPSPRPARRRSR